MGRKGSFPVAHVEEHILWMRRMSTSLPEMSCSSWRVMSASLLKIDFDGVTCFLAILSFFFFPFASIDN